LDCGPLTPPPPPRTQLSRSEFDRQPSLAAKGTDRIIYLAAMLLRHRYRGKDCSAVSCMSLEISCTEYAEKRSPRNAPDPTIPLAVFQNRSMSGNWNRRLVSSGSSHLVGNGSMASFWVPSFHLDGAGIGTLSGSRCGLSGYIEKTAHPTVQVSHHRQFSRYREVQSLKKTLRKQP
jgi:hypothetical protein